MSENLALWRRVCVTDPRAVKPITGKDYGGNSPKPYWIVERLTEEFGPCGIGWGYSIDSERFERFGDTDVLHVAKVTLWYELGLKRGHVTQMGQTKASYVTSKGAFKVDEDAPKKSVTDALVKCASYLGFAGDIFSGRWDDSKYVAEANRQWRERDAAPANDSQTARSDSAGEDVIGADRRSELENVAVYMIEQFGRGETESVMQLAMEITDNEEKVFLWNLLRAESKLRAFIKAQSKAAA